MMFRIAPASLTVLAIFNVASTLASGNFKVDYTVKGANGAVISDPRFSYGDGSGCGGSNAKCHCQVPSVGANLGDLLMVGTGTDGTATGLDFSCLFQIGDAACYIHVDIPYSRTNHLNCGCKGYSFYSCEIPDGGHDFTKEILVLPNKLQRCAQAPPRTWDTVA